MEIGRSPLTNGHYNHHVEIEGSARLEVGEILPETMYGRCWKITHVNADSLFARAVPIEHSPRDLENDV